MRYLLYLPLGLLTACALQQPNLPPQESLPAPPSTVTAKPEAVTEPAEANSEQAALPPMTDRIAMLQTWVDQQNRLYRIAAPLLIKNIELCPRHARHLVGLTAKTRYAYTKDFAPIARLSLGLGERLRVMNVLPGSGASEAGVRKGDILLSVENKTLPQGPNADRDGSLLVSTEMRGRISLNLSAMRDGKRIKLQIPLTRACAFGIELGNGDHVNSYADGHRVMVTRGMLDFTQSDEEVAYVLAKEIAHNVLSPSARADMGTAIDSLRFAGPDTTDLSAIGEIDPYSPVLDATADKLSLYMLARAGYDIENALAFWKRLASKYPADVRHSHTELHPSTKYRFSVMNEIAKVIKMKQKKKLPLVP